MAAGSRGAGRARLHHQAIRDGLTGLANRWCLEAELARSIEAAGANRSDVLLHIDLDRFKVVNDRCGRAAGDRLLRQVTGLLKARVRDGDLVARLDGNEFAIILRSRTVGQAHAVAGRICDDLDASRFNAGGGRFRLGASIGLVAVDRRDPSVAVVAGAADDACQAAKEAGRNRIHVWKAFDPAMLLRSSDACCLLHKPELLARLAADGSTVDAVANVSHAAAISSGTRAPLPGQLA